MRLLLLAPFPYGAASGHGGAMVGRAMLHGLSREHQVEVLCFSTDSDQDRVALAEMRSHAAVHTVRLRVDKAAALYAKFGSLLRFRPEGALYYENAHFAAALVACEQRFKPDAVITQFPQMAQYLSQIACPLRIHDVQDAFSVSWYRRACSAPAWRRPYAYWQWLCWVAYERRHYRLARQCWTLSEQDAQGLHVFSPELDVQTVGIPLLESVNGAIDAAPRGTVSPDVGQRVGFIASFGHAPNVEALEFLVREIAPALQRMLPSARICVAGRQPPQALVETAPANVDFAGFVDSVADFYASCDLVVAPLLSGGGVKIKVVEAMGYGKAVVTTAIGAEGIAGAEAGACLVTTLERMPREVVALLRDDARRTAIASMARQTAAASFAAQGWRERVGRLLAGLMERPAAGSAGDGR